MENKTETEEYIDQVKSMPIEKLCKKLNCTLEEICLGNYIARETKDTVCPYKVILGFADFEGSEVTDLGKLEVVFGNKLNSVKSEDGEPTYLGLNIKNSKITNLGKLRAVYGLFYFDRNLTSLGNLEFLGSGLNLNNTSIRTLGKVRKIKGKLNIEDSSLESLGNLEIVEEMYINSGKLRDLGNLEKAGKISVGAKCGHLALCLLNSCFVRKKGRFVRNNIKKLAMI